MGLSCRLPKLSPPPTTQTLEKGFYIPVEARVSQDVFEKLNGFFTSKWKAKQLKAHKSARRCS